MSSAAGLQFYGNQMPSFAPYYDTATEAVQSIEFKPSLTPPSDLNSGFQGPQQRQPSPSIDERVNTSQHQHRESTSTQTSDSTDSSPTTTVSTVDSSSISDPSPNSSPESPVTIVPLSSFARSNFHLDAFQNLKMIDSNPSLIRPALINERPMTSPGPRKFKNFKSLNLKLNSNDENNSISEFASPSFIKPSPLKARKKPSLLSLNTGHANQMFLRPHDTDTSAAPTVLRRRSLKHSFSSPHILSTPAFGPSGGMTFGESKTYRLSKLNDSNLTMENCSISEDAEPGVQMATRVPGMIVGGDSFDRPQNGEDARSPAYPDGPILMYEPCVYLYSEPKKEEAEKFDVVINVAKEVKNPFMTSAHEENPCGQGLGGFEQGLDASASSLTSSTIGTPAATTEKEHGCASNESSPTTPRPTTEVRQPEYIHVPWDHNTDVKDELWGLCQTIQSRAEEGKRVLIHCQQGASRSATLIIAYGMFLNQDLGSNDAYNIAQAKSRWVNPNMSLLFSLNDFKKIIEQKKLEDASSRKTPTKHRQTLSADTLDTPGTPSKARRNSTSSITTCDAQVLRPEFTEKAITSPASTNNDFAGFDFGFGDQSDATNSRIAHPTLHFIERPHNMDDENRWSALMSPRVTEMTKNPLHEIFSTTQIVEPAAEVPPNPALFSPRAFEFPTTSLFPVATELRNTVAVKEDPRSPPIIGEVPITRSIDQFL